MSKGENNEELEDDSCYFPPEPKKHWGRWIEYSVDYVGEFFSSIATGFERVLVHVRAPIFNATEFLGSLDSAILTAVQWLLIPFFIGLQIFAQILTFLRIKPVLDTIFVKTYLIWYPLIAVGTFGREFWTTRQFPGFWLMAMILFMAAITGFVGSFAVQPAAGLSIKYREAIIVALDKGDYRNANLYLEKLRQMGGAAEQFDMGRIENLFRAGNRTEALDMVTRLAPLDRTGFAAAHFWQAQKLIDGEIELPLPEALRQAEVHLGHVRKSIPLQQDQPELILLDAMVALKRGDLQLAEQELSKIRNDFWPATVLSFEIHCHLGENGEATADCTRFARLIERESIDWNTIHPELLAKLADCLSVANERDARRRVVQEWYQQHPDDELAVKQFVAIELSDLNGLLFRGGEADLDLIAKRLSETCRIVGPNERDLVAKWIVERIERTGYKARMFEILARLERIEQLPPYLLETMGTVLVVSGDFARGKDYLAMALKADPSIAIGWNNYAYALHQLAGNSESKLKEALEAANSAVDLLPDNFDYRETRGAILNSLGMWDLAAADLRLALNGLPNSPEVHLGLAQAYRGMGNIQSAEFHESQGKALKFAMGK